MSIPVTFAELRTLESDFLPSHYTGVYRKGPSWQARLPWSKAPHGTFASPLDAAKSLVLWWRREFGPDWQAVYAERELPAVEVVPDDAPGCTPGFVCFAHAEGVPVEVTPPGGGNWPTRSAAADAGRWWRRAELGLFAGVPHFARRGPSRPLYARRPYPETVAYGRRVNRRRSPRRRLPLVEGGLFAEVDIHPRSRPFPRRKQSRGCQLPCPSSAPSFSSTKA